MTADEDCVFCRIVSGDAPASIVFRDHLVMAFMDIRPINPGHLLVIPLDHIERISDVSGPTGDRLFAVARRLAGAVQRSGLRADGVNLLAAQGEVAGQEVFHAHLHVVPRFGGDGFGFARRPGSTLLGSRDVLEQTAAAIRVAAASPS